MGPLNGESKTVIALMVAVILVAASVSVFWSPNSSKDPIVGDWYCVLSEKYTFDGDYVTTQYVKGDYYILRVSECTDDMFHGRYDGVQVAGFGTAGHYELRSLMDGEYNTSFKIVMSETDDNVFYATETRTVLGTDLFSVGYYVCAKDVSKVIVTSSMQSFGQDGESSAVFEQVNSSVFTLKGLWAMCDDQSSVLTSDGELDVSGWTIDISEEKGHLFKGVIRWNVDGVEKTKELLGVAYKPYSDRPQVLSGIIIGQGTNMLVMSVSDNIMRLNGAELVNGAELMSIDMCFTQDGAVPGGHKGTTDLAGQRYVVTESKIMDEHGVVSDGTNYDCLFKIMSKDLTLYIAAIGSNDSGTSAGYVRLNDDGSIRGLSSVCAFVLNGEYQFFNLYSWSTDGMKTVTSIGMCYIDGNWRAISLTFEMVVT